MKVKEKSEKTGLKLNIQKSKIMASGPITLWQIDGGEMETVTDFIFLSSKITADGDCSHEIKRHLLLERKALTNLGSILRSRDITLLTKVHIVKAMAFPAVIHGCERWTIKKTEHQRMDAFTADGDCNHEIKRGLLLGRKVMTNLDSILKKQRHYFANNKVRLVKAMVFPVVMYGCDSWTVKKGECRRTDAFELWCWIRLLRVPWTTRRSNQCILKEITGDEWHHQLNRHELG